MNAFVPIAEACSTVAEPPKIAADAAMLLPAAPFHAANAQVNEWRGRCLDAFTRGETAVTECLSALSGLGERGKSVKLPLLIGQRLDSLSAAICAGGPFAAEAGKATAATLEEYRGHAGFRNMLCHGTSKVTLDSRARWTLILRQVALRGGALCRETLVLDETEAQALREQIARLSQRLASQLGQVSARVTATPTA
ncbi:hypothetical protein [Sphingomonas sp.]|jgi:hypothetical protein|uniref:hypothetical protein n=1 Tax=Sphingomonas sp. TaxID=28214 RepID=UPI002612EF7F|nr:hypothetical protein [Sphingomonas sp.]MDF2493694.1 hypothetical protein [Sphingomonas sp.]